MAISDTRYSNNADFLPLSPPHSLLIVSNAKVVGRFHPKQHLKEEEEGEGREGKGRGTLKQPPQAEAGSFLLSLPRLNGTHTEPSKNRLWRVLLLLLLLFPSWGPQTPPRPPQPTAPAHSRSPSLSSPSQRAPCGAPATSHSVLLRYDEFMTYFAVFVWLSGMFTARKGSRA